LDAKLVGRDVRPAAQSLSFASPKESNQRKGDPAVCVPALRFGQPAVLAAGGVPLELGYRLRQSRSLIHPQLCSSAHTEGGWGTVLVVLRTTLLPSRELCRNARHRRASSLAPTAVMRRRVAQGWTDQGTRLFERSEFERHPVQTEQRSVPEVQRRDDAFGSLFLCLLSFGEAKESESQAGARPGPLAGRNN
jgi:hypothetical protein